MSAPDTNIKTQEKRHKGPLSGMILAVVIAALLFLGLLLWLAWNGNDPGDEVLSAEQPAAVEGTIETGTVETGTVDTGTAPLVEPAIAE